MLDKQKIISDVSIALASASPTAAVATAERLGWTPADWMYGAAAALSILQGAYLVWKWRREIKKDRDHAA